MKEGHRDRDRRSSWRKGRRRTLPFLLAALLLGCAAGAAWWILKSPDAEKGQAEGSLQEQPGNPESKGEAAEGQTEKTESEETVSEEERIRQEARRLLDGMSLEEKAGQMFIARCPEEEAAAMAEQYQPGGYLLFARDFEGRTKEQAAEEIQSYQAVSRIPMLIGVDEEGGTVTRISRYPAFRSEPFASSQELYQQGGFEAVAEDTLEKCELLKSLGVNVNFAPVCDVSENPEDFIYERSFGQNAELTAEYVKTVVEAMEGQKVACVLKHFPGYGSNADTHTGIAYDSRPYEVFEASDFLPFRAGIEGGAQMVLVSHNIVSCMDGERPASLSARVHEILREELGFSGVIVTDDLAMDGIRDFTDDSSAAVLAVQAGNDLICCTDFETQIPAVIAAVEAGTITEERIEESVLRILELKLSLGMMEE